jgi:hypothetical protein
MTEKLGPEANEAAPGLTAAATPGRTQRQALRRQVLLGGATTAGVILALANRPALAGGGTQKCDPAASLSASMAASHGVTDPTNVGLRPTCWQAGGQCYNAWAPGATCNNQPVSCNHGTTLCSLFPQLSNTSYFQCSSSATLSQFCSGSVSLKVKCGGQWINLWSSSQQPDICAAIVNDCFYGDFFSTPAIITQITNCLNTVQIYSTSNNSSGIQSTCNSLYTSFHSCNNRNPTSCSI